MTAVTITFRKYNKSSEGRRASACHSSRKKHPKKVGLFHVMNFTVREIRYSTTEPNVFFTFTAKCD